MPEEAKRPKHREIPLEVCILVALAVLCITILETVAMLKGIDGKAFGLAVAAIAGIVGGVAGFKITTFLR